MTREEYADKKAAPLLEQSHKNHKECSDIDRTMRSKLSHIMPYLQGADFHEMKSYDTEDEREYGLHEFLMHELENKAIDLCLEVAALKETYDKTVIPSSFKAYQDELKRARGEWDEFHGKTNGEKK